MLWRYNFLHVPDNIQSSRYYTTYLIIYAVILSYFWDSATTVFQLVYLLSHIRIVVRISVFQLNWVCCWFVNKIWLRNKWEIQLNFPGSQDDYYYARKHVTKTDKNCVQSNDFLDLNTAAASKTYAAASKTHNSSTPKMPPNLKI